MSDSDIVDPTKEQPEFYRCACGIQCKNRIDSINRHFKSQTHQHFLKTGVKIEYDYDPSYPVGDYRRTLKSRLRAIRKYNLKKRLERRGMMEELHNLMFCQEGQLPTPVIVDVYGQSSDSISSSPQ